MAMTGPVVALAVVTSSLLQLAVAHNCADGSRVRCTAVTAQSIQNAPRAAGGKSAIGSPFCTPSGEKVYCLKEHSYHQCADGEEPCCQDGTNPSHSGNYHGDSGTQCSAETSPMTTPEPVQAAAQAPIQIVLDDMEQKSTSLMANAFEGSFQPCMQDAWKGQFHHDWARRKGSASYTFKVNVPESGCYKLEEYHPGSSETCARYLPNNAQLDVNYCKGKSKTIWVNQAANAAQWNEIDSFMFYAGTEGELTMRNHNQEDCRAQRNGESCFWVVDAFRLTRTGATCGKQAPEPEPEPEPKMVTASQNVPAATTATMQTAKREGTLMLQASLYGGSVRVVLAEHQVVLETVLAAHLGHKIVQVVGIYKQGRRLHGGGEHSHTEHFKIEFQASNAITAGSSPTDLRQTLQDAFDKVVVGMKFQSAVASWGWEAWEESKDTTTDEDSLQTVAYIIAGAATLVTVLLGLGLCVCFRARKRDANNDSSQKTVAPEDKAYDLESTPYEKKQISNEKAGDAEDIDVEVASVSTGTPGSDDDNSEGSRTVTPSNSMQQEPEVVVSGQVVHDL